MTVRRVLGRAAAIVVLGSAVAVSGAGVASAAPAGPDVAVTRGEFPCSGTVTNVGGSTALNVTVYDTAFFATVRLGDLAPGQSKPIGYVACTFGPIPTTVLALTGNGDANWLNNVAFLS